MSQNKSYFFQSYALVVIAVLALIGFKQVLPNKIFTETTGNTKNVVVDSLALEAAAEENGALADEDTLRDNTQISFEAVNGIKFPTEKFDDYKGYQHLVLFYEKLLQLETKQQGNVRIAYFGDSMTDGDMIVKEFRSSLQSRFGGEGVGFVNITSESAASRSTVSHQFSSNWKTLSYLNVKNPMKPFGVNGHVFFVKKDTVDPVWVKYKASTISHLTMLNNPTLFYGKSGNREASVDFIIGKDTINKKLNPSKRVNALSIGRGDLKTFKANFKHADSIPFYGFNFDDGKGVHVDNFSNRGNSGLPIATFNTEVMKAFNERLGYDLIVLQYGTNILNYGSLNYTWYERKMARVVAHLRECFPGVAILIVSTADKSSKYDLEMKTDSAVVPVTRAQRKYAVSSEAAYVNLYTLMGGDGSMVKWVEEAPARANKDYTHFNFRGAKQISDLIYKQINNGYEQYKRLRGMAPAVVPIEAATPAQAPVSAPEQPKKPEVKKQDSITKKPDTTNAEKK